MREFESSRVGSHAASAAAVVKDRAWLGSVRPLRRQLRGLDLVAYGLTYIALVSPLSTMGFVWVASGGQIALAYLIGLVCISFTALSYATMARRVPEAGSAYAFTRHALGHRAGFLAGWLLLLDYLLIPALVFVMMSIGMDTVAPGMGRMFWLVALVVVTLGINWWGIKVTTRASLASVVIQVVFLVIFLALCVRVLGTGAGNGAVTLKPLFDAAALDWEKVLAGAGICMLSFLGFDAISTLTEEVRADSPQKAGDQIARATLWVLGLSGLLFLLIALIVGNLLPAVRMDDPAIAVFTLVESLLGPAMLVATAVVVIWVSGFTNALPMQAGVARVLFAMARDGQLPGALAVLHQQHGTPYVAMLLSSGISLVVGLLMLQHVELLTQIVNFGALAAFAFLHVSVLRTSSTGTTSGGQRFFQRCFAGAGLLLTVLIISQLNGMALGLGFVWLAVGVVLAWRSTHAA